MFKWKNGEKRSNTKNKTNQQPKIENTESLKKDQHDKIENVAGSVWLSLFMDGTGQCKLPSTPPSTGLSRIHHLNIFDCVSLFCAGLCITVINVYCDI
jgi:hypothetical protein